MQIEDRVVGNMTVIDLNGRMTRNGGYGILKDKINSLVQQGQRHLLLNLAGVPYMDSTCVGEIVSAFITVRNNGGKLKLLNLTRRIQELLVIANCRPCSRPSTRKRGRYAATQTRERAARCDCVGLVRSTSTDLSARPGISHQS